MQNGLRVYKEMSQEINRARDEVSRVATELETLNVQLHQARSNEAQQISELAQLRLGLLSANQIASELDAADRRAQALLQDRTARLEQLNAAIKTSVDRQTALEASHEKLAAVYDQALSALNAKTEAVRKVLQANTDFITQSETASSLAEQARLASEKANLAEADRIQKRKPYEQDRLFVYLWERRFGFPGYRSGPLLHSMDAWVARLIGYERAHRNYRLLLALADHMREHATTQQHIAEAAAKQLEIMDQQALAAAGVPILQADLFKAEEDLQNLDAQLDQEEKTHQQLLEQRAAMIADNDPFTVEAMKILETQMSREDLDTLRRDVQATPTPKDDALVARLANLRAVSSALCDRVSHLQSLHNQTLKQLEKMEEFRTRFRSQGYDSENSEFEDEITIGSVLQSIFQGAIETNGAWEQVRRRQKFRIPLAVISGLGSILGNSGNGRSAGKRSSGGFRSGGSVGGRGFKTGGGF